LLLIEGAVSALLAIFLRKQFDMSRFSAAVRCGGAAVIATGATSPCDLGGTFGIGGWTGTWWGTAALGEAGVVLV
jgi:hypothetical protein